MMATAKTEYRIDPANVTDGEALHNALAAALPLPEYYGRNLDAFYDVLTEFGGNWRIVFRNADSVCQAFRDLCADAMAETEGLEIVFLNAGERPRRPRGAGQRSKVKGQKPKTTGSGKKEA